MAAHRVLLVEDDPLEATLAKRTLLAIDNNVEVVRLRDGIHFLKYYKDNRPLQDVSLAIMDLHMPRVDAFGILQVFRKNDERMPFPVVMFSSSEDQEEIQQAYDLGAAAYVHKPTAPKDYRAAMEHIVNFWLRTNRR